MTKANETVTIDLSNSVSSTADDIQYNTGGTVAPSSTYVVRADANPDPDPNEALLAFIEQYRAAVKTGSPHDLNAVFERGKALGLEKNGRVTIPAAPGEWRSVQERQYDDPKDIFGHSVRVTKSETRVEGDESLQGYAAMFNRETIIGWWYKYREMIAPGSFTKTIQEADVRHLFNHDPNWVLGRNKSGTLRLTEDNVGLRYDVDLNLNDPQAVTVREIVNRGDVDQSSFAFIILRELWEEPDDPDGGALPLRTILEARLFDTSTVTYPAYEETTAMIASSARSATLRSLGVSDELIAEIAVDRFTPGAAQALREVAQQAEELAARCEDGAPCPEAAGEAPQGLEGNERAAEEAPGDEGADREEEQQDELLRELEMILKAETQPGLSTEERKSLRDKRKSLLDRLAGIPSDLGGE